MTEGIGARVGRIISGTVNMLVEAMEHSAPEMVMEEAIREIDTAIDEVRGELGREMARKHGATNRLTEENRKHEELTSKIELAVKEGRDDLGEAAIAQQLDVEAQIPILEHTIAECGHREKEFEGYIAALQAKKREMRDDLRNFRNARAQAATVHTSGASSAPSQDRVEAIVERAESTFDRVLEKASGLPGSSPTPDRKTAMQLAELDDLARKNRIQERLAAAKSRAKKE